VARYFFHLTDGHHSLIDPEGREIVDPSLIGALAPREARTIISQ
jgi:hypothetical protein